MKEIANALQKLIPKELDTLKRRYSILNNIQLFQPIGRRSLAQKLNFSEKSIRSDVAYFKSEGLIQVTSIGVGIEPSGLEMLDGLKDFMRHVEGLNTIEEKVRRILDCENLLIVSGDADEDEAAKIHLANVAAKMLLEHLKPNTIVALTGGSTVHRVINQLKPKQLAYPEVLAVPARGSLGNHIEYHANTLVSALAKKINCKYLLLNIPDNLSQRALESVREEPDIQQSIAFILKANIIVYGIGNVDVMVSRRSLDESIIAFLKEKEAVAEVMGYYFNKFGEIVYTSRSIGINIDEMKDLNYPIAVAGGSSKAQAILAVRKFVANGCLIIDEGAAKKIIEIHEVSNSDH
ncbi:MAG: sugar-binding transcriptional regulator [Vallitaleaceae bacterium]|nr:sugar-binding transcriptional regulator [Vallitaleaceae bacterium]